MAAPGRDAGETLIEILIALVIMGLAMTALLTGLAAASRTAAVHKDEADANTYLVQVAEKLKSTNYATTCPADKQPYKTAITGIVPTGWTATAVAAYWDAADGDFSGTCADDQTTLASYRKMHQLTITVTKTGGIFDSIVLVKRYQA